MPIMSSCDSIEISISDEITAEIVSVVRKSIRLGALFQPDYGCLLGIYGLDKIEQCLKFVSMPCRFEKPGEFLWVYVNGNNCIASVLFNPLRALIEPFSVCGGDTVFQQMADGFIVVRRDVR
jgi:hypothetical protein